MSDPLHEGEATRRRTGQRSQSDALPPVYEYYASFSPPKFVLQATERLLIAVPPEYLAGIGAVVLRDAESLSGRDRRRKTGGRGRRFRLRDSLGVYHRERRGHAASIELFVDNILRATPRWALATPGLRDVALGETLYHEIGHHIHASFAPEYRDPEQVAEQWRRRLTPRYFRSNYRYLLPFAYALRAVLSVVRGATLRLSHTRSTSTDQR